MFRLGQGESAHFDDFQTLYAAFYKSLEKKTEEICADALAFRTVNGDGKTWKRNFPMTVVALFEEGCIGKALDYGEGGPVYNIVSPHIGGAPDAGNSLYAVDKLCFRERLVSFDELMAALAANWEGYEVLREYARKKLICYGNDSEADAYTARILDDFADILWRRSKSDVTDGLLFPPAPARSADRSSGAPPASPFPSDLKRERFFRATILPRPAPISRARPLPSSPIAGRT